MSERFSQPRVFTAICYKPNSTGYVDRSGYCSDRYESSCAIITETDRDVFVTDVVKCLTKPVASYETPAELIILLDGLHLRASPEHTLVYTDPSDEELLGDYATDWLNLADSIYDEITAKVRAFRINEDEQKQLAERRKETERKRAQEREELATLARLRAKHPNA